MDERRSKSAKPLAEEPCDHPISSEKDYLSSSRLLGLCLMWLAQSQILGPKYCDFTDRLCCDGVSGTEMVGPVIPAESNSYFLI